SASDLYMSAISCLRCHSPADCDVACGTPRCCTLGGAVCAMRGGETIVTNANAIHCLSICLSIVEPSRRALCHPARCRQLLSMPACVKKRILNRCDLGGRLRF